MSGQSDRERIEALRASIQALSKAGIPAADFQRQLWELRQVGMTVDQIAAGVGMEPEKFREVVASYPGKRNATVDNPNLPGTAAAAGWEWDEAWRRVGRIIVAEVKRNPWYPLAAVLAAVSLALFVEAIR